MSGIGLMVVYLWQLLSLPNEIVTWLACSFSQKNVKIYLQIGVGLSHCDMGLCYWVRVCDTAVWVCATVGSSNGTAFKMKRYPVGYQTGFFLSIPFFLKSFSKLSLFCSNLSTLFYVFASISLGLTFVFCKLSLLLRLPLAFLLYKLFHVNHCLSLLLSQPPVPPISSSPHRTLLPSPIQIPVCQVCWKIQNDEVGLNIHTTVLQLPINVCQFRMTHTNYIYHFRTIMQLEVNSPLSKLIIHLLQ